MPKTFRMDKEAQKKIEEIVKETIDSEVFTETLGEKIGNYLENQRICKSLRINFYKHIDLKTDKSAKIKVLNDKGTGKNEVWYDADKEFQYNLEKESIIESILELENHIKRREVVNQDLLFFTVVTDDLMYKVDFEIDDNGHYSMSSRYGGETIKIDDISYIYFHLDVNGTVRYLKFNKDGHDKIINALEENGYDVTVNIV